MASKLLVVVILFISASSAYSQQISWTQVFPAPSPSARSGAAMAFDPIHNQSILFGGLSGVFPNFKYENDTWAWDGINWTQMTPSNSPSPRQDYAVAYDTSRNQLVLFGGINGTTEFNDTWIWDGTNWTQRFPTTSPSVRFEQAMAYDAAHNQIVLFGGQGPSAPLGDVWIWDGTNWTEEFPSNTPSPRFGQAMAYDAARHQVVMFGGANQGGLIPFNNDNWFWDGTNWTLGSPSHNPNPRVNHGMVFDNLQDKVVMLGGQSASPINDVWLWNGSDWEEDLSTISPPARGFYAFTYDSGRNREVVFGGADATSKALGDTWLGSTALNTTGTIVVTTNTPAATFEITGPASFSGTGLSNTFNNAPAGIYTISFGDVVGFSTPAEQVGTLDPAATLSFVASYNLLSQGVLVAPDSLDFGIVPVGASKTLTFVVQNLGSSVIQGTAMVALPFSLASGTPFTVAGHETQIVEVSFVPQSDNISTQRIEISSNGGAASVQVSGRGLKARAFAFGQISPKLVGIPVLRLSGCVAQGASCPNALTREEISFTDIEGNYFFDKLSAGDYIMPVSSGAIDNAAKNTNLGPKGYIFQPEFCQAEALNSGRRCSKGTDRRSVKQDFLASIKPSPQNPPFVFKLPVPSGTWRVATEAGGYTSTNGLVDADPSHTDLSSGFYAIDIRGECGTPILASADGTVIVVARNDRTWGNTVVIKHSVNIYARYAHLHSISVRNLQRVTQGQTLGLMGSTGLSFGAHVHFQLYNNGFNPLNSQSKDTLLRQVRLDIGSDSLALIGFVRGQDYTSTNENAIRTVSCTK